MPCMMAREPAMRDESNRIVLLGAGQISALFTCPGGKKGLSCQLLTARLEPAGHRLTFREAGEEKRQESLYIQTGESYAFHVS